MTVQVEFPFTAEELAFITNQAKIWNVTVEEYVKIAASGALMLTIRGDLKRLKEAGK